MNRAFARSVILALALFALAPRTLTAQAKFGGQVNWGDDADIGLGARVVAGSGVTSVAPYVGGGLNIAHSSNATSNTELGVNLLGGLRFGIGPVVKGFSEVRLELSGGEQFVVTFGVLF